MHALAALPFLATLAALLALGVLALVLPRLLTWGLSAAPLARGALRQTIETLATEAGVSLRDVLIWSSARGKSPNALAVGMARRSLRIFLNDALLQALPLQGVTAVCAHELAHAHRRHGLFYLAFVLAFVLSLDALGRALWQAPPWVHPVALGACFLLAWGAVLPVISRRFEEEADLTGAEIAGWSDYLDAVRRFSHLGAYRASLGSWRHPTPGRRLHALERLSSSEACRHRLRRRCRRLRAGILTWLALGTCLFAAAAARDLGL